MRKLVVTDRCACVQVIYGLKETFRYISIVPRVDGESECVVGPRQSKCYISYSSWSLPHIYLRIFVIKHNGKYVVKMSDEKLWPTISQLEKIIQNYGNNNKIV